MVKVVEVKERENRCGETAVETVRALDREPE